MDDRTVEITEKVRIVMVGELVHQYADELAKASVSDEFFNLGTKALDQIPVENVRSNFVALPEAEKVMEFRRILAGIPNDSSKLDLFSCRRYVNVITSMVDQETAIGKQMAHDLLDFIYDYCETKVVPRWENLGFARGLPDHEKTMMMNLLEPKQEDLYLKTLATNRDDSRFAQKVGMLLKARSMPAMADRLRFLLGYGDVAGDERRGLEFLLRDILGYPELEAYYRQKGAIEEGENLPLPLSLSEVYENYDFSRYPVSLETEKFRMRNLTKLFERLGVGKEARVCDAGCGTGWLTGELLEAGFSNLVGLDIDPVNIKKAEEMYPEAEFVQGEIEEIGELLGHDKLDVVLMLGRTGTHAEDWDRLNNQMFAVNEALEMGGYLIMDWPNPRAKGGIYEEYVNCVRRAYKRHGFSEGELEGLDVVVDGPATATEKSKAVYNRLVPDIGQLKQRLPSWGFRLELEVVEELPNGTGKDENVVLVLRKTEDYGPASARAYLEMTIPGPAISLTR